MQSSAWLLVHVPDEVMAKHAGYYSRSLKGFRKGCLERCFTTVALRVSAKVLIWKVGTESNYSECNDDLQAWDLINQVEARIQDLHTILPIR